MFWLSKGTVTRYATVKGGKEKVVSARRSECVQCILCHESYTHTIIYIRFPLSVSVSGPKTLQSTCVTFLMFRLWIYVHVVSSLISWRLCTKIQKRGEVVSL